MRVISVCVLVGLNQLGFSLMKILKNISRQVMFQSFLQTLRSSIDESTVELDLDALDPLVTLCRQSEPRLAGAALGLVAAAGAAISSN